MKWSGQWRKTRFNIFEVLGRTRQEHSSLLAWLLNPDESHGFGGASYVELTVSEAWAGRNEFVNRIKTVMPEGFEHVSDYPEGALEPTSSIFKYIPYDTSIGSDGRFDGARFLAAFKEATAALVNLESDIDGILARLN